MGLRPHSLILALSLLLGALLATGCGEKVMGSTAPEIPGEPLTNPKPDGGTDSSFVPYLPPPPSNPPGEPIPTYDPPPFDSQSGQGSGGDFGDPVFDPNGNGGLDLLIDVQVPAGGSLQIDIDGGGNSGRITLYDNLGGGPQHPGFDNGGAEGPRYDSASGQLIFPLVPGMGDGFSVYLTLTVLDGQGNPTGDGHGITLPPGWTPLDQNQGSNGQQF